MQRLQTLQPEIKKIQARYKDDKQRLNQEIMAFYQREKVNPLGSCLPLLLQIPFFIALFQLLRSRRRSRRTSPSNPGFYPIDDLADKVTDPVLLGVLIVLYVGHPAGRQRWSRRSVPTPCSAASCSRCRSSSSSSSSTSRPA